MMRRVVRVLLVLCCLYVGLVCLNFFPLAGELLRRLPFGWWSFLGRTLPQVTWNWSGAGMVALCSLILLVGVHSLCGWVFRTAAQGADTGKARAWPWRWTAALFAGFWLLFALVMGASGLRQHLVWLSEFDAPLYSERRSGWAQIKQADGTLATSLLENTNPAVAYAAFRRGEYERIDRGSTYWEEHHVLMFTNTSGKLVGYILFPRNPVHREYVGYYASGEGIRGDGSATNLPAVIAQLEALARR